MDKIVIKQLLVPLDGSSLAETVLPIAAKLAKKIDVSITLIHIIEKDAPSKVHGQTHLTKPLQAKQYLNNIASMDIFKEIIINTHVHETGVDDVSLSISDHSIELNQDLVIICTHGSAGLHNLIFGSVAEQVISFRNTPVLQIKTSRQNFDTTCNFDNFLIPLDGNPEHEKVLNYASAFANMCKASIHLLMAIPQFGNMSGELTPINRFLPGSTTKMMDMIVPDAEDYLSGLRAKLERSGLKVTTSSTRNDPAKAIKDAVKNIKADLVILATHGRKGADAFWEGSVTPKVSKSSKIPLLLVPV